MSDFVLFSWAGDELVLHLIFVDLLRLGTLYLNKQVTYFNYLELYV